jgi:predicted TIM-barrel fold metal-dependent hydrolase
MLEFMFETTRAVTNLILSGTLDRFTEIRVIVPHAGAALPVLADRIVGLAPAIGLPEPVNPERFFSNLKRLYYDLAGFPLPRLAPALMSIADPQRIMYGSDWPFTPMKIVTAMAALIEQSDLFDQTAKDDILINNALRLFPRFILETAS